MRVVFLAITLLSSIRVLGGSCPGGFDVPMRPAPGSLAMFDFDADGHADALDSTRSGVSIRYGHANGSLGDAVTVTELPREPRVAVADLDRDTRPDLVVTYWDNSLVKVGWQRNEGTRTFSMLQILSESEHPGTFALAEPLIEDFTADGALDVLVFNVTAHETLLINDGRGTFTSRALAEMGYDRRPASGDFNGDGRQDLLTFVSGRGYITFYRAADGTFIAGPVLPISSVTWMEIADFDGNGIDDIAYIGGDPKLLRVQLTLNTDLVIPMERRPNGLAAGNFNNDAYDDLAVSDEGAVTTILLSDGSGFVKGHQYSTYVSGATDENGDGNQDLIVAGGVLYGNGQGAFAAAPSLTHLPRARSLRASDVDGDGLDELVVARPNEVVVADLRNHANTRSFPATVGIEEFRTSLLDARGGEIVIGNGKTAQIFRRSSDGTWNASRRLDFKGNISAVALAELTGDNRNEIAIVAGDELMVFDERSTPMFEMTLFGQEFIPFFSIASGDLNGDGHADLAVSAASVYFLPDFSHASGSVHLVFGTGTTTLLPPQRVHVDRAYGRLVVGDFNRDGIDDIAAWAPRYTSAEIAVRYGVRDGFRSTFSRLAEISLDTTLHAGDINGDGFSDLVLFDGFAQVLLGTSSGFVERGAYLAGEDGSHSPDAQVLARIDRSVGLAFIARTSLGYAVLQPCMQQRKRAVRH